MPPLTITDLRAAHFTATTDVYHGTIWAKRFPAQASYYLREHVIDGIFVTAEMAAQVEVVSGRVLLHISAGGYIEGPYEFSSEEAQLILQDAMAACLVVTGQA